MTSLPPAWLVEIASVWIKWEYRAEWKRVVTFIGQCGGSLAGSLVLPCVSVTLLGGCWASGLRYGRSELQGSIQSIHEAQPSAQLLLCHCSWKSIIYHWLSTLYHWLFLRGRHWEKTLTSSRCFSTLTTCFKITAIIAWEPKWHTIYRRVLKVAAKPNNENKNTCVALNTEKIALVLIN